jgi:general secretion pathway protein D
LLALAVLGLAGCAAQKLNTEGMRLINSGEREQGIAMLGEASHLEPTNSRFRVDYLTQQSLAVRDLLGKADEARNAGKLDEARELYLATLRIHPANDRAKRGLAAVEVDRRQAGEITDVARMVKGGDLTGARSRLKQMLQENPSNRDAQKLLAEVQQQIDRADQARAAKIASQSIMKKPVTLQFRDANIRMVFEALSRTTGLNVIFDRDVRADLKTTIFVRDASVEDTVDLILLQSQLEKKVLNANTMFLYPATTAKQKEYQDLKVRTFQISNGDAKHLQNVLKTVLKVKDVALDERTNTLVLRDTADTVAVAEKIIAAHDLADPEVTLEVEVLEVSRDRLKDIGIKWPDRAVISTPSGPGGLLTLGQLRDLSTQDLLITPLTVGVNLKLQDTDANLLASPRIRTRNKEKARIMIGDKVPVITNTVTPVSSGSSVVTGSVQYLDVGIKLEVEPNVYFDNEVGIRLNLEVSNIVKEISGPQGSLAYQIGTRNATTHLRLRDGETQILGGLISEYDRNTASKVPGIGQLPVLGRLFSNHAGNNIKTEIILSITPRVVRSPATASAALRDVYSGTEAAVRENPLRLDPVGSVSGSAGALSAVAPGAPRAAPPGAGEGSDPAAPGAAPASGSTAPKAETPGTGAVGGVPDASRGAPETSGVAGGAARSPSTTSAAPAPRTPVPVENLPPSVRPGGIYKPAPPPQPAAPKQSPVPAPPDERVDLGAGPTVASAAPAADPAAAGPAVAATAAAAAATMAAAKAPTGDQALELAWQGPYRVKVGQEFQVAVEVNSSADLKRLPIVVRFDPVVLTFLDAQLAEFASKSGIVTVKPEVDAQRGRIAFDLQAAPGKSFQGKGVLLNLRFSARSPRQQTQLTLGSIELKDERGAVADAVRPTPLTLRVGS